MGQRTKGGMWCKRCGPVMGIKNMHRVRNTGSLVGELFLPGASLMGSKVEGYVCPNCGARVHRATGRQLAQAAGTRYNVNCPRCKAALVSPAGDNIKCPKCGFRMRVWALDDQPPQAGRRGRTIAPLPGEDVVDQNLFDVVLTAVDPRRTIAAIKVVRAETGLSLKDAKRIVDDHPAVVKAGSRYPAANALVARLADAGATAELRSSPGSSNGLQNVVIGDVNEAGKAAVLELVREATGLPMPEVIKIIETHEVIECDDATEAEALRTDLERAGATVDLTASLHEGSSDRDSQQDPISRDGVADELERIADLHRQGLLTDAEFAAAKSKALGT